MWDWFTAAQTVHAFLLVLAAIGAFRFAIGTRFWFPRYIHYLAAFASVLGLTCLTFIPADAPINQSEWGGLKKGLLVLVFPGLVYFFFVFHGVSESRMNARTSQKRCCVPTAAALKPVLVAGAHIVARR